MLSVDLWSPCDSVARQHNGAYWIRVLRETIAAVSIRAEVKAQSDYVISIHELFVQFKLTTKMSQALIYVMLF